MAFVISSHASQLFFLMLIGPLPTVLAMDPRGKKYSIASCRISSKSQPAPRACLCGPGLWAELLEDANP